MGAAVNGPSGPLSNQGDHRVMTMGSFGTLAKGGVAALALLVAACGSGSREEVASAGSATSRQAVDEMARASRDAMAGPVPGSADHFQVSVQDRVFFALDQYALDETDREIITQQAAWLQAYPGTVALIEGHADERGTREYNLALGARRASAIKDYMVSLGIRPDRLRTISYGKERPVAPGSDQASWRLNRRGVTLITGGPSS